MNIGILGAGRIAAVMADTIRTMEAQGGWDIHLYGVASRDRARAEQFAARWGVEKAFGSYRAMLEDPGLELVYIATPHSHHYQQIKLCADSGKHVLCEKAFTVNARQAAEAIRYARDRGVLVAEAIWTRYQPMRALINDTLATGAIGQPMALSANLCYPVTDKERIVRPDLAGGALLDVGIYPLNFAEMVFGPADGIQGSCIKSAEGVDLADSITLTWRDGRTAVLHAAVTCSSDRQGVVCGTDGYLVVENINNPQALRVYDGEHCLIRTLPCPPQLTGYEYELAETIRSIRSGLLECPSMPHSDTIHMMEVMDALRAQMALRYPCEGLD